MIENLRAAGYTTALYGECLNDAPENWYRNSHTGQPYSAIKAMHVGTAPSTPSSTTASASSSGSSTTNNLTVPAPTPTAVDGGNSALGSLTGNETRSATSIGAGGRKSEATGMIIQRKGIILICVAILGQLRVYK